MCRESQRAGAIAYDLAFVGRINQVELVARRKAGLHEKTVWIRWIPRGNVSVGVDNTKVMEHVFDARTNQIKIRA
jgi:hypothetical protein